MPLTLDEVITDGGQVAALAAKCKAGIEALPKPPAALTASDICNLTASLLPEVGALIDQVIADTKD